MNEIKDITDLDKITPVEVKKDIDSPCGLHMTIPDAMRIAYDLVGRGIIDQAGFIEIKNRLEVTGEVTPILHSNQYYHLIEWAKAQGILKDTDVNSTEMEKMFKKMKYTGPGY